MSWSRALSIAAVVWLAGGMPAQGQVARDGSLGSGTIGPGFDSDGQFADYVIDETHGALRGGNLFQSFADFSVGMGEIATFTLTQPVEVQNIIGRVTGGSLSDIDGTIRTTSDLAGAALFLLNPSGISFGQTAQLDVQGSFHASTADMLRFEDGVDFDAAGTSPAPLLSVASPTAFGFSRVDPGIVSISRSRDLGVPAGETLSLIGGFDSSFPGLGGVQIISASGFGENILAPDATVQLAAARPGIDIPLDLAALDVTALQPGDLGNVVLQNSAWVDVSTPFGSSTPRSGSVLIRGENFVMVQGAVVNARNGSGSAPAGPVDIAVTGAIEIGAGSRVTTWSQAAGGSGDVLLRGEQVSVAGELNSFNTGSGSGGAIGIEAAMLEIDGGLVRSTSTGTGPGGSIAFDGGSIRLVGGSHVTSETFSAGAGGAIELRADGVTISNAANDPAGTFVSTNTLSTLDSAGAGGALVVDVATLDLTQGGQMFARTAGAGDAGALSVSAAESVQLSGADGVNGFPSGITSRALQGASGNGGRIEITTPVLEVENGAQIAADTFGAGPAGDLEIIASERVTLEGGANGASVVSAGSFSRSGSPAQLGPGGVLRIETGSLELRNGGQISASATGTGDAGRVELVAEQVEVSGAADPSGFNASGVFSQSLTFGVVDGGEGGDIAIDVSGDIAVFDGGRISARSDGSGNGGSIALNAPGGAVSVSDRGQVTASASGTGNAGNIAIIAARDVRVSNDGGISARSDGAGTAGDILVEAGNSVQLTSGGEITTEATTASGGNIKVTAAELVYLLESQIETNVAEGEPGENAGDVTIDPEFVVLNASHIIANARGQEVDAGNITIITEYFFTSGDSFLQASAEQGIDGQIEVTSPATNLTGVLTTLPTSYLDASALLASACAARTGRAGSFTVQTREALPPLPDAPRLCPLTKEYP